MTGVDPVVPEYEVFQNKNNAVVFFMSRQSSLDEADPDGPFWFTVHEGKNLIAGSEGGQAYFSNVANDVIETAKERGVILLIEFENQEPVRCTPCYFTEL
jgi:hypothetical protein